MKKSLVLFGIVVLSVTYSCKTIGVSSGNGASYGMDRKENINDTTGTHTVADPDGVTGSGSTYGTGTGVSGQTPAGTGSGTPDNGRSGVGIQATPKISK